MLNRLGGSFRESGPAGRIGRTSGNLRYLPYAVDFSTLPDGTLPSRLTGATWTVSGGKAINTPGAGSNLVANGDMELDSGWANDGTVTTNERSNTQAHGGTYSRHAVTGATAAGIKSGTFALAAQTWYRARRWVYGVTGLQHWIGVYGGSPLFAWQLYVSMNTTLNQWVQHNRIFRTAAGAASGCYMSMDGQSNPSEMYYDDAAVEALTTADLFALMPETQADVIVRAGWTMPDPLNPAGVVANLDNPVNPLNFVVAYHDRTNAVLVKCVNGTYTQLISAAATYAAGASVEIRKIGTTYKLFYNGVQVGTDQTVSDADIINDKRHGTFSTGGSQLNSFFVGSELIQLPLLMIGDSKTAGFGSIAGRFGYGAIEASESPTRIATSGWTTYDARQAIDAALAARSAVPQFIFINLGANHIPYLGTATNASTEAQIKENYSYVLSALNAKYPGVPCYLMKVWYRGYADNCNTLAGWIDDIIAANPNAHAGPDERIFLENGDNGVTWTSDGVHPNDAGYALTARQWRAIVGL